MIGICADCGAQVAITYSINGEPAVCILCKDTVFWRKISALQQESNHWKERAETAEGQLRLIIEGAE